MSNPLNAPHLEQRPRSINELAHIARAQHYENNKPLKYYLRFADKFRNEAIDLQHAGDYENAFINFAKAATLVFEIIPAHPEFKEKLSDVHRANLDSNGKNVLDRLGALKPTLVDRYERWLRGDEAWWEDHSSDGESDREEGAQESAQDDPQQHDTPRGSREHTPREDLESRRTLAHPESRSDDRWRIEAGRETGTIKQHVPRDRPALPFDPRRQQEEPRAQHDQRQQEMKRRQEEIARRQQSERREQEREGITRRHAEAERAAQLARIRTTPEPSPYETLPYQPMPRPPISPYTPTGSLDPQPSTRQTITPQPPPLPTPTYTPTAPSHSASAQHARTSPSRRSPYSQPHISPQYPQLPAPASSSMHTPQAISYTASSSPFMDLRIPLENPSVYDGDSTDSESVAKPRRSLTVSRPPVRTPSYPPPVTTTSPPPQESRVSYPNLMSHHQKTQGYTPSSHSMFISPRPGQTQSFQIDSSNLKSAMRPYSDGTITRSSGSQIISASHHHREHSLSQYSQPKPPPEALPLKPDGLKTVVLPRESLPRFLSIARVNTLCNKETCGLLLGRDKGHKFAVTTLLIPKQHSTSDTCTMDEEELVLSFTEERNLITLGWIHTHPSQSCFMSSLDLHTHASFQRMLPESFAVVCAPSSNPNFGIFRLTDPPGLQTVLDCTAKEAFHPHPNVPIYTDADKGHVQMKDVSLEIVDLR